MAKDTVGMTVVLKFKILERQLPLVGSLDVPELYEDKRIWESQNVLYSFGPVYIIQMILFPLGLELLEAETRFVAQLCRRLRLAYLCFHAILPGLEFLHYFVFFLRAIFMPRKNIVGG